MSSTGVLLLGFGGPDSLESVEPFMRALTGREPSPELLKRVRDNYSAIGGRSPLAEIALRIARGLEAKLAQDGHPIPVRVGMRYWHPYIPDALRELAVEGCTRVVAASLSPFESKVASGAYRIAISDALAEMPDLEIVEAPLAGDLPEFAEFLAEATQIALSSLDESEGAMVAFTAHSLPVADLSDGDPYVAGLRRVSSAVAQRLGWAPATEGPGRPQVGFDFAFGNVGDPQPWALVYQSKGARPGDWLEPSIDQLIDAAKIAGARSIVVCPIGFVTDHMETLFDLDIVAAAKAREAGLEYARASVPNDDELLVSALAETIARLA
jgi:protoporphyrin/coproporphyrin ferrochelatase